MGNHDKLIETLSRTARPVTRTPPTPWRVVSWVSCVLPTGALAGWQLRHTFTDWSQPGALTALLAMLLAFIAGTVAIFSAFNLSIAGRKPIRPLWLTLLVMSWLVTNLINASHTPIEPHAAGDGMHCYQFMLAASLPMMVFSVISLRRTRTLYPTRSLALAGCGIAFMTATLLSFCHPVELEMPDLLMHLAAALTIIAITVLGGRRWVALD